MANNYSISNWTTIESSGDSVGNGTILSPVYLYITPNTGYVIQASDFSVGSSLPPEAVSVAFTNTTTALAPTNLVKVTVDLAPWYVHGTSAFTIDIDIDGSTHATKSRLNFTTIHNSSVSNVTQTLTATNKTTVTSGDITTNTCYLDIEQNTSALVASFVYTAASDYHLTEVPYFQIISQDIRKWSSIPSDQVYNSDNQLTSIKYSFYYNMGTQDIPLTNGESIILDAPVLGADRTTCAHITSVYYENYRNNAILEGTENSLQLNVVGTENATYNIKIEDNLGLVYNFETNLFSREGDPFSSEHTIYSRSKQIALRRNPNRNTHAITIPENLFGSATYTTTVTPTGSTKSSSDCSSTEPFTIVHNKLGVVDYVITTAAGTYGVNAASTSVKSVLNKKPLSELSTFNPADFPREDTANNGYFTYSQTLSYTVTDTVDGAYEATNVVLDTSVDTSKIQVGDAVTGTNVAANTTVAAINVSSNNKRYTFNQNPTTTVTDGTTLTFTRTVGISRQPLASDIRTTSPITTYNNLSDHAEYVVSTDSTNSTIIYIYDDEGGDFSDIDVGMLVEGDNIAGTPTVLSVSKGVVILSSAQSLLAGDSVFFSVAGSKLWIDKIEVTGAGTSSCKLNIDGYIQKMGNVDVAAEVVLSNFINVYAAPTITAGTATVALGAAIIIFPLDTDTSANDNLEITEITSSGNGTTSIGGDKKSIKYLAPLTGTTDTISYKVSDGVSAETSAANIVITLTP